VNFEERIKQTGSPISEAAATKFKRPLLWNMQMIQGFAMAGVTN